MKRRMSWREEDFTALRNELEEKTAELIVPSEGTNLSVSLLRRTHIVVIEIRNVDGQAVTVFARDETITTTGEPRHVARGSDLILTTSRGGELSPSPRQP